MSADAPAPPAEFLDSTRPTVTGATITVNSGQSLQDALDAAEPGDEIVLEAGATFTDNHTLPNKGATSEWIIIRSSGTLPAAGERVSPAQAAGWAKIKTDNAGSAIGAASSANHYWFIGLELYTDAAEQGGIVHMEDTAPTISHIVFDCCYIHGNPAGASRFGLVLNTNYTQVINCYVSDFKKVGDGETKAILIYQGRGPFKIVNNYLEAGGENVMIGGADPNEVNLIPSDIEFRRNYCYKPLTWNPNDPNYGGTHWGVKNLFELKNARRVLVDGNIFENNWVDGQNGMGILFTVRNQDGSADWCNVIDVTFTNNILRNSAGGMNILGSDDINTSGRMARVLIENNVFEDIGVDATLGSNGRWFTLNGGLDGGATHLRINHNTAIHTGNIISFAGGDVEDFDFINNISRHNTFGIIGDGTGTGNDTISAWTVDATITKNVMAGGNAANYPAGNEFPVDLDAVEFVDLSGGDYRLTAGSAYNDLGTDGLDLGADIDALEAAQSGEDEDEEPEVEPGPAGGLQGRALFMEDNGAVEHSDPLNLGRVIIGTAGAGGNSLTLAHLTRHGTLTTFAVIDTTTGPRTVSFGGLLLDGLRATLANGTAAKVTILLD